MCDVRFIFKLKCFQVRIDTDMVECLRRFQLVNENKVNVELLINEHELIFKYFLQ